MITGPDGGEFDGTVGRAFAFMDWDKLKAFQAVAEAGSFTRAGEVLNLSQPALSRQILSLEESLDVALFHRHARGVVLTEQGELLYRTVKEIFAKLATTEALIEESRETPKGPLRVTTTPAFGTSWLIPRLTEFFARYPDVSVQIVLARHRLDLAMLEADVAIRMMFPDQPELIQRRLMRVECRAYASPSYVSAHGSPETFADLDRHRLIAYGLEDDHPTPPPLNWLLTAGTTTKRPRRPVLEINSLHGVHRAVKQGLGIAALPSFMREEIEPLVPVFPEVTAPTFDVYFVYPAELRHSKRIAVFRDFLFGAVSGPRAKVATR